MARYRTIKPEFYTSGQVLRCSRDARLLFIGMWNFAHDNGAISACPKSLKAKVYPSEDDITTPVIMNLLKELQIQKLIMPYKTMGQDYYYITGWHHQKIDRPKLDNVPKKPSDEEIQSFFCEEIDDDSTIARRMLDECSTNVQRLVDDESEISRRSVDDRSSLKEREECKEKNVIEINNAQQQSELATLAPSLPSVAHCDDNSSFIHNVMNDKPSAQRVINAPRVGEWIYCKGKKTKRVMTTQAMADIFEFWRTTMDKSLMTQLDFSRAESIQFALENFDLETCKQAIIGCTKSPWHMGKNPSTKGEKFNDLTHIFKDIAKTEGFISKADKQETEESFVEAWTRIASMA